MGFAICRPPHSTTMVVQSLSPQDRPSSARLAFTILPIRETTYSSVECNRGQAERTIVFHFRRSRWGKTQWTLHPHRLPNRNESIRNASRARSRRSVTWLDGSSWGALFLLDNGH